jgi:hypothetical protein
LEKEKSEIEKGKKWFEKPPAVGAGRHSGQGSEIREQETTTPSDEDL